MGFASNMMRIVTIGILIAALIRPASAGSEGGLLAYEAGDYGAAYRELGPIAATGDAASAYVLSRMYFAGQGVPRNPDEGLKWLRLAATRGEVNAQVQLATRFDNGVGLAQDDAEAFRWYRRAADQGSPAAQLQLGIMYGNGRGTPVDLVEAHVWLNLATASLPAGEIRNSAAKLRDTITTRLAPEQIAIAHQRARDWRAARLQ